LRHIAEHRLGHLLTAAVLVTLSAGCARSRSLPTPEPPTSTSTSNPRSTSTTVPIATAAPALATPRASTAAPSNGCTETAGSLQADVYRGIAVAQDIPYNLYLPPCYDAQDQNYPTLYLLHGYPYDEAHWQRLGAVEIADEQIGSGEWPPVIMVMPLQPEPLFRGSDGGPGSYETELLEGLVPYIESNFRSDPSKRALGGISRGGVWALEIAFRNPDEFGSVAALSPALAVNSARPPYDPFEIVVNSPRLPGQILLLAGDEDWAAIETKRLSGVLSEAGVKHTLQISSGNHSDETWAGVLKEVLGFLALAAGS